MINYINTYLEEMAETKSPSTVKGHKSSLLIFAEAVKEVEPIEVTVKDIVNFRNEQYEEKTTGTVNTMLKRVKKFFAWCEEAGLLDISPAKNVKLLVEGEKSPKWLTEKEEDLLIKLVTKRYLNNKKRSYRELAIVMLMLKAGLRISEVTNLKWSEVQIIGNSGKALIRGKGQQQRTVTLIKDLVEVLQTYVKHHGKKGEYVFYSQKSDTITVRMVQKIFGELKDVSVNKQKLDELHPHMLRHTFAHNLVVGGMELEAVARLMGHMKKDGTPNTQQTIRYTMASDNEIENDMNKILGIS